MVHSPEQWFNVLYMVLQARVMNYSYYDQYIFIGKHTIFFIYVYDCPLSDKY